MQKSVLYPHADQPEPKEITKKTQPFDTQKINNFINFNRGSSIVQERTQNELRLILKPVSSEGKNLSI